MVLAVFLASVPASPADASDTIQNGFSLDEITNVLNQPVAFGFTPAGRMYVAEKRGTVQVFDSVTDPTPTQVIDVSGSVHDYWDRGLLGLAVDPQFGSGSDYLYLLYTYDPGNSWGDDCADSTGTGCMVNGRLSRFPISPGGTAGAEQELLTGKWCAQFPSHTIGDLAFSSEGYLLVSAGDGASFNFADHGQNGNPCGDPMGGPTVADNMGGALRSQRPTTDPQVTYDGTILRIDKATGAAIAGNPTGTDTRIIAQGLRNPFRIATRPGTSEIWVGDVGWAAWEEVNRIVDPAGTRENFGWPCYEGNNSVSSAQPSYDTLNLNLCENLYTAGPSAVVAPFYARPHQAPNSYPGCPSNGGAVSGLAFYQGGDYPAPYDGALFIADYAMGCIRVMFPSTPFGVPNKSTISSFVGDAAPVDLQIGPEGDLYYADIISGTIVRVAYNNAGPTAVIAATPTTGGIPLQVQFDGTGSTDPEGDPLSYAWDLDGDGQYDDSTLPQPVHTYTNSGQVTVGLKVSDPSTNFDTDTIVINPVSNQEPTANITTPTSTLTWSVGNIINFAGNATDPEDGPLPPSALTWQIVMNHCEGVGNCHEHVIQTITGANSGSFTAPDHPYPSFITVRLTATDTGGLTNLDTVELQPNTSVITIDSSPGGLSIEAGVEGLEGFPAPYNVTAIEGGSLTVNAPNQTLGGVTYNFSSWSDGQPQTHTITVPVTDITLTATYTSVPVGPFTLTASGAGSGSGQIRSTPAGIRCGTDCTEAYTNGTVVNLTATPTAGSTFAGWSGACIGTGTCAVTMNAAKTVTATFNTAGGPFTLTVSKTGTGSGTVTSAPAGINCGTDCTEAYTNGTVVTLTASPVAGSTFAGWSGACTGTGTCAVTMNAAKTVTATFNTAGGGLFTLTVSTAGSGSGQVKSNPAGIRCGTDCTEAYTSGTIVNLTASPFAGSTFAGWSGACTGTGTCAVTMNAANAVTATFNTTGTAALIE